MSNIIALCLFSALLIGQQQVIPDRNSNDAVEIPPSNQYVVCGNSCAQPTPKIKKTVLKRAPEPIAKVEMKSDSNEYTDIQKYLKMDKSRKTEPLVLEFNGSNAASGATITARKDAGQETAYFEDNSSVLSKKQQKKLASWLGNIKADKYEVSGYTCLTGPEKANKKLAGDRALAVKNFISAKQPKAGISIADTIYADRDSIKNPALARRTEIKAYKSVGAVPVKQTRLTAKTKQQAKAIRVSRDPEHDIDEDVWEGNERQASSCKQPATVNSQTYVSTAAKQEVKEKPVLKADGGANKQRVVIIPIDGSSDDEGKTIFLNPQKTEQKITKTDTKEAKK